MTRTSIKAISKKWEAYEQINDFCYVVLRKKAEDDWQIHYYNAQMKSYEIGEYTNSRNDAVDRFVRRCELHRV